jgi:hypothetical protein
LIMEATPRQLRARNQGCGRGGMRFGRRGRRGNEQQRKRKRKAKRNSG